jgi:hypothetical protein
MPTLHSEATTYLLEKDKKEDIEKTRKNYDKKGSYILLRPLA